MSIIKVNNLVKKFRKFTLDIREFSVEEKEKVFLLGGNGSGKTTLLKLIAGAYFPSSGEIIRNYDFKEQAFLPNNVKFNFNYSVQTLWNLWQAENKNALYNAFDLEKIKNKKYSGLSDGERQRLHLSFVLSQEARIYLLDEPTRSLDKDFTKKLAEIINSYDATFIIASHNKYFIELLNFKVFSIKNGKLV